MKSVVFTFCVVFCGCSGYPIRYESPRLHTIEQKNPTREKVPSYSINLPVVLNEVA